MSGGLGKTMRRAALLERTRRRSASEIRPVSLARSFPSTGHKSPLTLFTTRREDSAPNHVEPLPPQTEVTSRREDGATARVRSSRRLERRNKGTRCELTPLQTRLLPPPESTLFSPHLTSYITRPTPHHICHARESHSTAEVWEDCQAL